ncbi:MAG: OmpA family protein [Rhabdochlamydiaceae bacterium]|jgi:peptidoglycan-associated lipoprotein
MLSSEEFIPLNEDDLKNQFKNDATPISSLGEDGVPGANEFSDPQGELASIFKPVFFNTDEYVLKNKEHLETIHRMISYLKAHPGVAIIVEGHCDERGPGAYNMALGAKRANYVRSLLVKEGVDARQVHTISCGKEMPFKEGHDPDAWSQNRRGHFRIYKK